MLTTVSGGTGAGCAMHRRKMLPTTWTCPAGHKNKGYAVTCLTAGCREKRPKES